MGYKAMLFDLDDTLLNRDKAVDNLFLLLLEKCYENVSDTIKTICYRNSKNLIKENMALVIKR